MHLISNSKMLKTITMFSVACDAKTNNCLSLADKLVGGTSIVVVKSRISAAGAPWQWERVKRLRGASLTQEQTFPALLPFILDMPLQICQQCVFLDANGTPDFYPFSLFSFLARAEKNLSPQIRQHFNCKFTCRAKSLSATSNSVCKRWNCQCGKSNVCEKCHLALPKTNLHLVTCVFRRPGEVQIGIAWGKVTCKNSQVKLKRMQEKMSNKNGMNWLDLGTN